MRAVRAMKKAVGPILAGFGAWCALGDLTVVAPDAASVRLAAPAPWPWLGVTVAAAALVGPWRRHPALATPAILSVVPWLPVPLPAVVLMWTGPLAWLPIVLAASAGWWSRGSGGEIGPGIDRLSLRASAFLAGALTLAAAVATALALDPRLPGGDEPHYLIVTQSLIEDGDLRIENNHAARHYAAYFSGELRPDFVQRGQDGEIYSIHAPGASVLVLPAFLLFGYPGAQATILLLAAFAGGLLWQAGWLATGDRRAAWFATLAVVTTPTFLIQAVTIFPDGPGAFVVAAGLVLVLRLGSPGSDVSRATLATVSAFVASLPWLHTRFSVLAAGLGLVVAWLLLTDARRSTAERWRRMAAFFLVPAVSAAGWFLFFQVIYGTPNPTAPYGADRSTSLAYVPGGLVALFADAQFGLVVYSPVFIAAAAAVVLGGAFIRRGLVLAVVGIGLANMAAAATYWMWWAGVPAPPARFAAASLPLFVVPLALAWRHARPSFRAVWSGLLVVSIISAAVLIGVDRGALAWNVRGVRAAWLDWLSGLVDLSRGWPSFFWQLTPTDLRTELHFATHVLVWGGTIVAGGIALAWVQGRGRARAGRAGLVAAWCVLLVVMAVAQAGWWVNGASGLNAARSQTAVLGRAAADARVYEVRPGSVARRREAHEGLRIRATRSDPVGEPRAAWLPFFDLPPGRYAVQAWPRPPTGGRLTLRLGRSPVPLATHAFDSAGDQAFTLSLPAGAAAVVIEPDEVFAAVGETIEIAPQTLGPLSAERATARAQYGDAEILFLENTSVLVEPEGFWVRGGFTARFVIVAPPGRRSVPLQFSNGGAANQVTVAVGGAGGEESLEPWESRTRDVPVNAAGLARLDVTSAAGFRSSDEGPRHGRYLGVRITVSP
jgi:hypothetical protein